MTRYRRRPPVIVAAMVGFIAVASTAVAAPPARRSHPGGKAAPPATRITGRIVDDQGHPLSGVVVDVASDISFADDHTARTGRNGRYSIVSTPGPQDLTVDGSNAKGGDADRVGYVGSRSALVSVRYGRTTSNVDVTMHPGGAVRGLVTDAAGHSLNGVVAYLTDVEPYVYSEDYDDPELVAGTHPLTIHDGTFRIGGVRAGAYQLCFDTTSSRVVGGASDRVGYESRCGSRIVAVTTGRRTSAGSVPLARSSGGVLFGRVTGRHGHPVAGVQVNLHIHRSFYSATTGSAGWYRIQDLPAGSARICYATDGMSTSTATGFAPVCRSNRLAVRADRTRRLDKTLAPGGAVRGVVRAKDGAPLDGVIVDGTWGYSGDSVVDETNGVGRYVMKNLPARKVDVCFAPDFSAAAGPGNPYGAVAETDCPSFHARPAHVTTGVDVNIAPAGAISGTVRDQNGKPLRNVEIDLEGNTELGNEGEFYALTDAHGRYRAVDLPPVKFEVCYSNLFFYEKCYRKSGATHASEVQVRRGKDVSGIDATLSTQHNNVSVVADDSDGHPLAGANAVLLKTCHDPGQDDECLAQPPAGSQTYTVEQSDVTGARGRVTWPAVAPGSYVVCTFGYYATTSTGAPATGFGDACDPTPLTVTTSGNQTARVTLPTDGAVSGRVTTSAGKPIAGVRVHISGSAADDFADSDYDVDTPTPHWDAYTDANGYYTVRSVTPGTQTACFDPQYVTGPTAYRPQCVGLPPGSTSGGDTLTVSPGQTTSGVDIGLSPAKTGSHAVIAPDSRRHSTLAETSQRKTPFAAGLTPLNSAGRRA